MNDYTIYEDYLLVNRKDGKHNRVYYCKNLGDWEKWMKFLKKEKFRYFYDYSDYVPKVENYYFPLIIITEMEDKSWGYSRNDVNNYESEKWFVDWMTNMSRRKKLERILK